MRYWNYLRWDRLNSKTNVYYIQMLDWIGVGQSHLAHCPALPRGHLAFYLSLAGSAQRKRCLSARYRGLKTDQESLKRRFEIVDYV